MTTFLIFENTAVTRRPLVHQEYELPTYDFLNFSVGEEFEADQLVGVLEDNKIEHTFTLIHSESERLAERERFSSDTLYYTCQRQYFITIPDETDAIFFKMACPYVKGWKENGKTQKG